MLILNPSCHVMSDPGPAASCASLVWLAEVLVVMTQIGPAGEYVCYSDPQLSPLTRNTSVYYPADICALEKEQDPGWGGTGAEHDTLRHQHSQPTVLYITMCFLRLMGTVTEHCISETSHQSPSTTELLSDRYGQQEHQHEVGLLLPPIIRALRSSVSTTDVSTAVPVGQTSIDLPKQWPLPPGAV